MTPRPPSRTTAGQDDALGGGSGQITQSGFQIHLAIPIDPAELVVVVAALAKRSQNRAAD